MCVCVCVCVRECVSMIQSQCNSPLLFVHSFYRTSGTICAAKMCVCVSVSEIGAEAVIASHLANLIPIKTSKGKLISHTLLKSSKVMKAVRMDFSLQHIYPAF